MACYKVNNIKIKLCIGNILKISYKLNLINYVLIN